MHLHLYLELTLHTINNNANNLKIAKNNTSWFPQWLSSKESTCETQVPSLGQEDPQEKERATDFSIFA